jgi:hypothetical protein
MVNRPARPEALREIARLRAALRLTGDSNDMGALRRGTPDGPHWTKLPGTLGWGIAVPSDVVPGQKVEVRAKGGGMTTCWVLRVVLRRQTWSICTASKVPPSTPLAKVDAERPVADVRERVAAALARPDVVEKPRRRACPQCGLYCPPPGFLLCRGCRAKDESA